MNKFPHMKTCIQVTDHDRLHSYEHSELHSDMNKLCQTSSDSVLRNVKDNVTFYIAGYIAKNLRLFVCNECRKMLTGHDNQLHTEQLFLNNKQIGEAKEWLITPTMNCFTI